MRYIEVGIPTLGRPVVEKLDRGWRLGNMLIGKDFHWQRAIEVILPGVVIMREDREYPVINRVPVEEYLRCVVGSEMNPDAPVEFLKAHAVISRSWALGKINGVHDHSEEGKVDLPDEIICWEDTCDHAGFDVCSDDHCQRYQGIQPLSDNVRQALEATAGEVLVSEAGKLVDARFSKCCGGRTEVFPTCWQPREEACLESFDDPWCNTQNLPLARRDRVLRAILKDYDLANEGGYIWTAQISADEVRRNLKEKFGRDIGQITDMQVIARGESGRARLLLLKGTEGELRLGKELMIRRLLSASHLYSSRIELAKDEADPTLWKIRGRGWGHGVGLCQIGAARMALEGYGYRAILEFYYPGSKIAKAY